MAVRKEIRAWRRIQKQSSVSNKRTVRLHLFHWHTVGVLGSADGHPTSPENRRTWSVFACTRGFSCRKVDSRISSAQPDKYKTPLKGLNQQCTVGIPYLYMQTHGSTAPRPPFHLQHQPQSENTLFSICWCRSYSSSFTLITNWQLIVLIMRQQQY